jgi:hypothetical protein
VKQGHVTATIDLSISLQETADDETKEELKAALDIALDKQIELEDKVYRRLRSIRVLQTQLRSFSLDCNIG